MEVSWKEPDCFMLDLDILVAIEVLKDNPPVPWGAHVSYGSSPLTTDSFECSSRLRVTVPEGLGAREVGLEGTLWNLYPACPRK